MGRESRIAVVFVAAFAALAPADASAQEDALVRRCAQATAVAGMEARRFCNLVAQAIEVAQPVVGLAATGGNPVPGTASTLGMRLGALPRFSVAGRATGVFAELPPALDIGDTDDIGIFVPSLNVDAAVGIFGGYSPAPTVGGVASLDGLASFGFLPLPGGDDGFDDSPWTWAAGLRLGILRESFTLPGISVTGMYRRIGDFTFGDPQLRTDDAFFDMSVGIWSLRGAVSKRILMLGLTLGAAYDHYSSDVDFGFNDPADAAADPIRVRLEDFENNRFALFGNVSWTLLILHLVGELGWQSGADQVGGIFPAGVHFDADDGRFFGSLALRLSI
ncbi:MAG TPA: hypothetical protein VF158_17525 [Longimicrobiales bacterium]